MGPLTMGSHIPTIYPMCALKGPKNPTEPLGQYQGPTLPTLEFRLNPKPGLLRCVRACGLGFPEVPAGLRV